jgi:ubiquinone/menaquinone biosynthesis C-methylase UbiE
MEKMKKNRPLPETETSPEGSGLHRSGWRSPHNDDAETWRQPVYRKLAPVYDHIMKDVDYEDWTDYIDAVIRLHHPWGTQLMELACGTGTMALAMEQRDDYEITATDISSEMIQIARKKAGRRKSGITWLEQDMCRLDIGRRFDIIYMVFDSLNYLHDERDIHSLFESVSTHLEEHGIFVFDFTTPNFSPKIAPLLDGEQSRLRNYWYRRNSHYDQKNGIHINHFFVEKRDPKTGRTTDRFEEVHRQRIWSLDEIKSMVMRSKLRMLAVYEDFDFSEATDKSDRITMVLQHG